MAEQWETERGREVAQRIEANQDKRRLSVGDHLILSRSGSRASWVFRYLDQNGSRRDKGFGPYPLISFDLARARAAELLRRDNVPTMTPSSSFEAVARDYYQIKKAAWVNAKHSRQWIQSLEETAFPAFGSDPIDIVDHGAVASALSEIWRRAPESGRRTLQRINAVFAYAVEQGHLIAVPCSLNAARLLGADAPF